MSKTAAVRPYVLGVCLVTASSLLAIALAPWIVRAPTPLFTAAVLITAYYRGFHPAVFAAGCAAIARYMIFFQNDGTTFGLDDALITALFLFVAVFIGHLVERIRAREEDLRVTLASIGDAVITADATGNILFLNPVAEDLTGWKSVDARGKPLETIFKIINEETRQPAEAPVQRVLREGRVCGLANHTVLISRDGREIAIEDSAAPVKDEAGRIRGVVMVFYDVTRRREAERALNTSVAKAQQQVREIDAIYQSVPVGLCVLDADLRFVRINERLAEINGVSVQDHIGRTVREVVPGLAETAEKLAKHILSTGRPVLDIEFVGETPSRPGFIRSFNEQWLPIFGQDGQVCGINVVAEEVTERKRTLQQLQTAQETLNRANIELEQKVQERTAKLRHTIADLEQFSYSISHDLRAPLRSMNSFSTFLLEEYGERLDAKAKDYLTRIVSAAVRLDDLIRDVLTYSQVARNDLVLSQVDLDGVFSDVLEDYPHLRACRENVEVTRPLQPVVGNLPLVSQCASNLLSNAIKFVSPGAVPKVRVWTEQREGRVRLNVQDNGIGIAPAQMNKLWQIFQRGHREGEYPGTGIGLSIVKRAVESMGGSVGVESEVGKGSTFWFELSKPS